MMGVHFANGWVEATDAHILIREKYEYDSELEGKIIGRYGEEIDGVFPNCEKAIPKFFSEGYEPLRIDWNMLYDICRVLVILGQQHYCECAIKVGNCYFYPKHLKTIAAMCVRHECSVIYLCNARPCNAAAVPLGYGAMVVVARGESELFFDYGYPLDYGNRRERMSELHDEPSGAVTAKDHHAFVTAYYGNGFNSSTDDVAPILTTKDRLALVQPKFIVNEYGNSGNGNSLESVCPAICVKPKQQLVSARRHYLLNPQYQSKGRSVDDPCFTLIARMDKMPPCLVTTESGEVAIRFDDTDTPMMRKVKQFMADYGIIDIKMRMLKVDELKRIMGFPTDYVLVGTQTEQKKFIGNAVEVNMSRVLCEALAGSIECRTN